MKEGAADDDDTPMGMRRPLLKKDATYPADQTEPRGLPVNVEKNVQVRALSSVEQKGT